MERLRKYDILNILSFTCDSSWSKHYLDKLAISGLAKKRVYDEIINDGSLENNIIFKAPEIKKTFNEWLKYFLYESKNSAEKKIVVSWIHSRPR